jgi:hypothetical protein
MISAIRDSAFLRSISPSEVQLYLKAKGWTPRESSSSELGSAWLLRRPSDKLAEILVPNTTNIADYANRIGDILSELERLEGRPQDQIIVDVINVLADVVRVRSANEDTIDGTIPLDDGARLIQSAKELMLDAASSAKEPKLVYASHRPEEAKKFVTHSRLGQSEVGSYVITIISRLEQSPMIALFPDDSINDPFGRRVVLTLAEALDTLVLGSEQALLTGEIGHLTNTPERGVSANLCEAIVEMSGPKRRPIEISFGWSPLYVVPPNTASRVNIRSEHISIIEAVAQKIREDVPLEDFALIGVVTDLHRGTKEEIGRITVHAIVDGRVRKVSLKLGESDYANATRAHKDRLQVQCLGALRKSGRSYVLENPKTFDVIVIPPDQDAPESDSLFSQTEHEPGG